jgi:hypothetical protein
MTGWGDFAMFCGVEGRGPWFHYDNLEAARVCGLLFFVAEENLFLE